MAGTENKQKRREADLMHTLEKLAKQEGLREMGTATAVQKDERIKVARNMVKYGGHFIARIGEALSYADEDNAAKIKASWPEDWKFYNDLKEAKSE